MAKFDYHEPPSMLKLRIALALLQAVVGAIVLAITVKDLSTNTATVPGLNGQVAVVGCLFDAPGDDHSGRACVICTAVASATCVYSLILAFTQLWTLFMPNWHCGYEVCCGWLLDFLIATCAWLPTGIVTASHTADMQNLADDESKLDNAQPYRIAVVCLSFLQVLLYIVASCLGPLSLITVWRLQRLRLRNQRLPLRDPPRRLQVIAR